MKKDIASIHISLLLFALLSAALLSSCSTINTIPPEVNLMALEVQDVTLSHVNLLADLRIFNPNQDAVTIQGVDYTLHLENVKVFAGQSSFTQSIEPQEYGRVSLRLSSAYWNIIELFNRLTDKEEVSFTMQGSIKVGENSLFAKRYSFTKEGMIPLHKTVQQ
jgi:LEA14-like dessication related protein